MAERSTHSKSTAKVLARPNNQKAPTTSLAMSGRSSFRRIRSIPKHLALRHSKSVGNLVNKVAAWGIQRNGIRQNRSEKLLLYRISNKFKSTCSDEDNPTLDLSTGMSNEIESSSRSSSSEGSPRFITGKGAEDNVIESERNCGPVDLDEVEDQIAQEMLISYFEDEKRDDTCSVNMSNRASGPIDLDEIDDNYHDYDDCDDDLSFDQTNDFDNEVKDNGEAFSRESMDSHEMEGHRNSNPIDVDDIHDLETVFDTILDRHEDEYMVWKTNQKGSSDFSHTRDAMKPKYGESSRRVRKSSRWTDINTAH